MTRWFVPSTAFALLAMACSKPETPAPTGAGGGDKIVAPAGSAPAKPAPAEVAAKRELTLTYYTIPG